MKYFNFINVSILYNTNRFFSEKFLTYVLPGLFSSLTVIIVLNASEHNFFILKFHCFMLFLNFITSRYSLFRRIIRYGTNISRYAKFLVSVLVNVSSTTLSLPVLIVLRALTNLLEEFPKRFWFFTFLFLNFQQIISSVTSYYVITVTLCNT